MDSSVWEQWSHHSVTTPEGIKIHYVDVGPRDGPPVVMIHGWPDLWFGWRVRCMLHTLGICFSSPTLCLLFALQYQIQALSPKYRLIVPDVRGFGQSSTPQELEAYGTKNVTDDIVALLGTLRSRKLAF